MFAYATGLFWLQANGQLEADVTPDRRWPPEQLRDYILHLKSRVRPATVRHLVVNLERALAVLAPAADRSMFQRAVANLAGTDDRSRKRMRLQEPARLVKLGYELMAKADAGQHASARKNAVGFRIGLQVSLLAMRPFRIRNFCSIRIGEHLVRYNGGWHLWFPGEETKNHRSIEVPFPDELVDSLEHYLAHHRPLLADGRYFGDHLWLGYRFGPETAHTLQLSLVRVTQAAFGLPINPHLFRDCAATSIAVHDPEAIRSAASILGHSSFGTTEKYYNLANCLTAGRCYSDALAKYRR